VVSDEVILYFNKIFPQALSDKIIIIIIIIIIMAMKTVNTVFRMCSFTLNDETIPKEFVTCPAPPVDYHEHWEHFAWRLGGSRGKVGMRS
jgi:hypothetical protein